MNGACIAPASRGAPRRRTRLGGTLLAGVLLTALGACNRAEPLPHHSQLFALGTLVTVSLWGVDEEREARAVNAVDARLREVQQTWHAWRPGTLTRLNAALAAGERVEVAPQAAALLAEAKALAEASGQLFNPAIGRLIALWGFHSDDRPVGPPPVAGEIAALLRPPPTMADLMLDGNTVASRNPALQLDLGAFAKGYAVDEAIAALRGLGIDNAIVNAGGDLRAIGAPGRRAWRIGIRNPGAAGIIASLETHGDESVFTSGNYERYFDYEGRRYHHIIDPRSGAPAAGTLSVTVIHSRAATADAAATALFVAGPSAWQEVARRMGIDQVMLIDADMVVHMSPAMARRIRFETDPAPRFEVAPPS